MSYQLQGRKYKNINCRMDYTDYRNITKAIEAYNKNKTIDDKITISTLMRRGLAMALKDLK
jgi:hypothetical protein